ncbi:MAG: CRISPR-associated protein Csx19, partial [Sphaerospermopsis kisseleviana]
DDDISEIAALDKIYQQYILWGEGIENKSNLGWGKLATARIGYIDVPVQGLTVNKRVYLNAVEYLQADEEYGNVSVVEERLTGLKVK